MNQLGPWLQASVDHLRVHWQKHLPPGLAFMGATFVLAMVIAFCVAIMVAVAAVLAEATGEDAAVLIIPIAALVAVFVAVAVALVVIQPLYAGHIRFALRLERGEDPQPAEILWGFRNLGRVLGLLLVQGALGFAGALFCYFPAFLVGAATYFALPAMVDRDLGPIAALGASWALARPRFLAVLVLLLLQTAISVVLAYIPLVGPIATIVFVVVLQAISYARVSASASGT